MKKDGQEASFLGVMQKIDHMYEEYAKSKGMTYINMTILDCIYEADGGCTQKQICEITHYPKQSVNLAVRTFWEKGYVELKEIPSDRRNKTVCLTKKGEKFAAEVLEDIAEADRAASDRLSEAQREELLGLIKIYTDAFCENVEKCINDDK